MCDNKRAESGEELILEGSEEIKTEEIKTEEVKTEDICDSGKRRSKRKRKGGSRGAFFKGFLTGALLLFVAAILYKGYIVIALPNGQGIININLPTYYLFEKADVNGINERAIAKKLHEMNLILDDNYFYDADKKALSEGICSGMMYGVFTQDPYAAYYSNEVYKEEKKENAGAYVGIGIGVKMDPEGKGILILEVKEDSPALEAGIKVNDIIIEVDGVNIVENDLTKTIDNMIMGEAGTKVKLKLLRGSEELELECERRRIETKALTYNLLPGLKLGYIKINSFIGIALEQFDEAINELEAQDAKGLIIDVRDNPGGDMNVTLSMLDMILEDDLSDYTSGDEDWYEKGKTLLLALEDKEHNKSSYHCEDGTSYSLPIVVLANEKSASASEIFAGTLKAYGYPVVGQKTFGKGIVQATYQLADGSAMKFTVEQYLLPDGSAVHGNGVEPVYAVAADESNEGDEQLEKAKAVLWDEVLNGNEG